MYCHLLDCCHQGEWTPPGPIRGHLCVQCPLYIYSTTAKQLRKFTTLSLDEYEQVHLFTHTPNQDLFLPLSPAPSPPRPSLLQEFLAGYLEDHPNLMAQELLVLFLLQRNRYIEAQHIQEKIRPIAKVFSATLFHSRVFILHSKSTFSQFSFS